MKLSISHTISLFFAIIKPRICTIHLRYFLHSFGAKVTCNKAKRSERKYIYTLMRFQLLNLTVFIANTVCMCMFECMYFDTHSFLKANLLKRSYENRCAIPLFWICVRHWKWCCVQRKKENKKKERKTLINWKSGSNFLLLHL